MSPSLTLASEPLATLFAPPLTLKLKGFP